MGDHTAELNLRALKRRDASIVKILGTSAHVTAYTFDQAKESWQRKEVEGSLFVFERNEAPYHGLFLMNRLNNNNIREMITESVDVQNIDDKAFPLIIFRTNSDEILGMWFYKSNERHLIYELLQRLHSESKIPRQPKQKAPPLSYAKMTKGAPSSSSQPKPTKESEHLMGLFKNVAARKNEPGNDSPKAAKTSNENSSNAEETNRLASLLLKAKVGSSPSQDGTKPEVGRLSAENPTQAMAASATRANERDGTDSKESGKKQLTLLERLKFHQATGQLPPDSEPEPKVSPVETSLVTGITGTLESITAAQQRRHDAGNRAALQPLTKDQLRKALLQLLKTDKGVLDKIHEKYVDLLQNLTK
eukprot:m.12386 g.12386  ORF g.12386 m.12386 type:complete len:362 (+) comp4644_c0_seq1:196-1281(+)